MEEGSYPSLWASFHLSVDKAQGVCSRVYGIYQRVTESQQQPEWLRVFGTLAHWPNDSIREEKLFCWHSEARDRLLEGI